MNIIRTLTDFVKALTAYMGDRPLELKFNVVTAGGARYPVSLNNDTAITRVNNDGMEHLEITLLDTRPGSDTEELARLRNRLYEANVAMAAVHDALIMDGRNTMPITNKRCFHLVKQYLDNNTPQRKQD